MVIVPRLLLCLFFLICTSPAFAQDDPVVALDSVRTLQEINRGPKRALLWSIVPGGGQVYNKSWWKVPLVYSGLLGVIAVADYNQTQYSRFITALEGRCLGDGNVVIIPNAACVPDPDGEFPEAPNQAIITARNNANRSRQTAYFGIIAVYVLQAVEAFTDAHLRDFDISDDLSIRITPSVLPGQVAGATVSVPLGSGRQQHRQEVRVAKLSGR